MTEPKEKSLEELRAAIEAEALEPDEDTGTPSEEKSENQEASDNSEGTSNEPSEDEPSEDNSKEDNWLVPGRFRTQEDLLKAYGELESFTGRQSSEIQKLRGAIQEPPRRGETSDEKAARIKRFADAIQQDPVEAIKNIAKEEVEQVRREQRSQRLQETYQMRRQNPEFAELEPLMTELAIAHQDMIQANHLQDDPRILDVLFYAAKGIKAQEMAKQSESKGVKKGIEMHRRKSKAKIEGNSGTKKTSKTDLSKLSAAEMRDKLLRGEIDPKE